MQRRDEGRLRFSFGTEDLDVREAVERASIGAVRESRALSESFEDVRARAGGNSGRVVSTATVEGLAGETGRLNRRAGFERRRRAGRVGNDRLVPAEMRGNF